MADPAIQAAIQWKVARENFLRLPTNDPRTREFLGYLADAEDNLVWAVNSKPREYFDEVWGPRDVPQD